jgi:hypothetical protein
LFWPWAYEAWIKLTLKHLFGTRKRGAEESGNSARRVNLSGCRKQNLHFPWQNLHLL